MRCVLSLVLSLSVQAEVGFSQGRVEISQDQAGGDEYIWFGDLFALLFVLEFSSSWRWVSVNVYARMQIIRVVVLVMR